VCQRPVIDKSPKPAQEIDMDEEWTLRRLSRIGEI
jgi:hypothetical protein